jgi:hypothetical protein
LASWLGSRGQRGRDASARVDLLAHCRPRGPKFRARLSRIPRVYKFGNTPRDPERKADSPAIQARRKGGQRGGKARAKKLSADKRRRIAKKAARARWGR